MRALLLVLTTACSDPADTAKPAGDDPYDVQIGPYDTTVRWTGYGVPHVQADDYGSAGYGMGYAFARDHICTLADQVVQFRSERSKYFGPGEDDANIDRDLGWKALGVRKYAEDGFLSMSPDLQAAIVGYAAGYDRYLEEVGLDGLPEACRGADWVVPITHIDLLAYYLGLGLAGSGANFVDLVGQAQPPGRAARPPLPPIDVLLPIKHKPLGSNGWAIGADRSATGKGLLLSNTHFPYRGERQWWESHLTIGDQVDVYGAGLVGVPLVNVGFNTHLAWTHTVSNTPRFTAYMLSLDPDDPTRYLYDGAYLDMEATDHSIEVLGDDGLETLTRTLYRSHYGPIINAPTLGWSSATAIALRDGNENNLAMAETWMAMDKAGTLAEFQAAHRDHHGIPWVHTMMADDAGNAWYTDSATTPNISPEAEQAYAQLAASNYIVNLFADYGVIVFDGADPVYEWVEEDGAREPGLVPFDDAPQLLRSDFVYNANDNHWLSNPEEPLVGYPMLYGAERTPRAARTRMNATYLSETGEGSASGADSLWTLEELQAAALGGRAILAEVLVDEVVARCQATSTVTVDGAEVDLAEACAVLAAWDRTVRVDSAGEVLWRETISSEELTWADTIDAGALFAVPFDPDDPLDTPNTLAGSGDAVLGYLGEAVLRLQDAGIPLDATLADAQWQLKGDQRIPLMGGNYHEGCISVGSFSSGGDTTLLDVPEPPPVLNTTSDISTDGYYVNNGNSYVLTVAFEDDGPRAGSVLVYSQSEDPDSEHFDDQSWLYADGQFKDVAFTEAEVAAQTVEELKLTLE